MISVNAVMKSCVSQFSVISSWLVAGLCV